MTYQEAEEIVHLYEKYIDSCCSCHMGHPPCGYCTERPSEDDYEQALQRLERGY